MFLKPKRKDKRISYGPSYAESVDMGHFGDLLKVGEAMINAQFGKMLFLLSFIPPLRSSVGFFLLS